MSGADQWIMATILIGAYTIIFLLLYQIYIIHLKPIDQIKSVLQELIKGNYSARVYEKSHYGTDKLGYAVNKLAFNLQHLNRQEKMHSRQLRTVIDSMESGIMLLDTKCYVQLVNQKLAKFFNKPVDEMYNQLYYHVTNEKKFHKTVQEGFLYEETIKNSMTLTSNQQKIYLEIIAVPFFNETRDLRGLVLVFHDITELKRVEQMRKDFVANVSHELKTPITSIKGFAETLLEDDHTDPLIQQKFLNIIYKESDRLQGLIHDLLELSKLERDEFDIELKKVNLTQLIQDSMAIVNNRAKKRDIELKTNVPDDLFLIGDDSRLKQVLLNLLHNAINYSQDNGIVIVTAKRMKQWVVISIEDNGLGIPADVVDRIFERFYRVNRDRSRDTGGTGLGLAIVKHIVEAHQGFIEVESELDVGSTFKIYLPIHI